MSLENYYREKSEERLNEILSLEYRLLGFKSSFAKLESIVNSGKIQTDECTLTILKELAHAYETNVPYAKKHKSKLNETRPDATTRYRTLVELMNEDMSIADIAHRLGVTRSAIYLIREQYKEQLKIDVDRGMRAMQFRKR